MDVKITYGLEDNRLAKEIRQKVFVEEQGFENEFDEIDDRSYHIVLSLKGVGVATARLYEENGSFHIGRVAVVKEYRKQNLGEAVMGYAESKAKELGAKEIALSAQVTASGFYEKNGYKPFGEVYLDEFCPHIAMKKSLCGKGEVL